MVIIIGAGPIGLATGIELQKKGIPFKIIEKGCIVNSIYHYPSQMTFFSTSERLEIGDVPFISHNPKPTRQEALEYYRRVAIHFDLPLHLYEKVQSVDGTDGEFLVKTDKAEYEASKIVVATGFYGKPNMMGIPGEELPKVKHYYDDPHAYALQDVLVIGAGNSAVDAALETWRVNAHVTMAIRGDELKDSIKYWVRPDIENRIEEGSINAYFETTVESIHDDYVVLNTPDGQKEIANDFVLAMTGYHPNYDLMEKLNIQLTDDEHQMPVYDEHTLETARSGMYVAGVVCGGMDTSRWFIENARVHAEHIATDIAQKLPDSSVPAAE
ncbi:MAG: YpdA family putative bacillithiol disulfide reductase [Bacteroidota bacterium]